MGEVYQQGMTLKQFREAERLEAERQAEEAIAPHRKAFEENARKLAKIEAENIKLGLDEIQVSESLDEIHMTPDAARAWNIEEIRNFHERHAYDFYDCPENWQTLTNYFSRRKDGIHVRVVDQDMLEAAYTKLRQAGLIVDAPVKKLSQAELDKLAVDEFLARNPDFPKSAANLQLMKECIAAYGEGLTVETLDKSYRHLQKEKLLQYPRPEKPNGEYGLDPITHEQVFYSNRQISLMDSDTYRKCFPVARSMSEILSPVPAVMKRGNL
jgi:hypothetical protein